MPPVRIRELVADSFVVIRDFIVEQLDDEPVSLLGDATWGIFLNASAVHERELKLCQKAMEEVEWGSEGLRRVSGYLTCSHCGSELIKPVSAQVDFIPSLEFSCAACGLISDFEDIIEPAVNECWAGESHYALKDGDDPPIADCHECGRETFLTEEDRCLACMAGLSYESCAVCSAALGPEEQHYNGLCSYHAYRADKDD